MYSVFFSDLQCVRLDEMKKYKQLLQHYTRYSLEKSSHSPERLGASQLLHYGYVCNEENIWQYIVPISYLTLCQFYSSKNKIINLRVSKRVYLQLSDRRQYIRQQFLLGTIFCQSAARCKKTESSSHTKNMCHITTKAQRKQTIDIPASTSGHVAAEIDRDGSAGSVKVGESGGGCLSGRRGQWCHLYPWRPRKSILPHR